MAEHALLVTQVPEFQIVNTDLIIAVKADEEQFGTLRISRGGLGWHPRGAPLERHMTWERFNAIIKREFGEQP
ncbi:MAG TPA: hypothetical protein VH744_12660 [Terriglobales bacterium]|jgi:hypothetical protein